MYIFYSIDECMMDDSIISSKTILSSLGFVGRVDGGHGYIYAVRLCSPTIVGGSPVATLQL